jgi:hypothetical protein
MPQDRVLMGASSRVLAPWPLIFLLITSCVHYTEIPCPFGLTVSQLDEKCNFIQHGSTSKWILKKENK